MVKRYNAKPYEIEAIQWNGKNEKEVLEFVGNKHYISFDGDLYLITFQGKMKARIGDYIIKCLQGDFYSCEPDVFAERFELLS